MRIRFISFIVFQVLAWTLYFSWEMPGLVEKDAKQKFLNVAEVSPKQVSIQADRENIYGLLLRNDGFYTRYNHDQTLENGLWKINYELPAIILITPRGEHQYHILSNSENRMLVREVTSEREFARNQEENNGISRLFSSSSLRR